MEINQNQSFPPLLPFKRCKAAEVRCVGWLSMPGIWVWGKCSFQCLLYYWRVYAKAFYVRYIIKLFRISTKIDYLCIDRPSSVSLALHRRLFPRCSAALAAGCAVCTIFRMHDTTFFSSSWCTFEIICPKFSINSRYTHIDEKGVNHFWAWALRFDAVTKLWLNILVQFLSSFFSQPDFWFKQVQRQPGPLLHYCNIVKMDILSQSITLKGIPFSNHNWWIQWYSMRQKNTFHQEFLFLLFSSAAKRSKNPCLVRCSAALHCCGNYFPEKCIWN